MTIAFFRKEFRAIVSPGYKVIFLLGSLFVVTLFNLFYHPSQDYITLFLDRISFVGIALYSCFYFREQRLHTSIKVAFMASLAVCQMVWAQEIYFSVINHNRDPNLYSSTFGNMNMLAQYMLMSLVILHLIRTTETGVFTKRIVFLLSFVGLIIVVLSQARSAYIGLVLIAMVSLGHRLQNQKKVFLFSVISMVLLISIFLMQRENFVINVLIPEKSYSLKFRKDVLVDSIKMLKKKPLGYGVGNFVFNFIPFEMAGEIRPHETNIVATPHNEFLRLGIENGLVYLSLLLSLFVVFTRRLFSENLLSGKEKYLFLLFSCAFLPELFFQFPFDNAFPFFVSAIGLGWALSKIKAAKGIELPTPWMRVLLVVTCSVLLVALVRWTVSKSFERSNNLRYSELACELDRSNWRACFRHIELLLYSGDPEAGISRLREQLATSPYNYPMLKLLSKIQLQIGNKEQGCKALHFYVSIFVDIKKDPKNILIGELERQCSDWPILNRNRFHLEYPLFIEQFVSGTH